MARKKPTSKPVGPCVCGRCVCARAGGHDGPCAVSAVVEPRGCKTGSSSIGQPVFIPLPTGGYQRLLAACSAFSPVKVAGLVMVGSLLWQSRRRRGKKDELWCAW